MKKNMRRYLFIALLIAGIVALTWPQTSGLAQDSKVLSTIFGRVIDEQAQAVEGAKVIWYIEGNNIPSLETSTQADGSFALILPKFIQHETPDAHEMVLTTDILGDTLTLNIERPHFEAAEITLNSEAVQRIRVGEPVEIPTIALERHINFAFWIATAIFIGVLFLIATDKLHNTLAALVGTSLVLIISYLGHPISENFFIFDFADSLKYIDWNVIFLIMGMMIVIAVVENTGIFQWLAFFAYRISGGNVYILLFVLMLITGVASAFLDNVDRKSVV